MRSAVLGSAWDPEQPEKKRGPEPFGRDPLLLPLALT